MNYVIDRLVQKYMEEGHNYETDINQFRISEIKYCPRLMYYLKVYPEVVDTRLLRIFTIGHIIHKEIQNIIKEEEQVEIEKEVIRRFTVKDNSIEIIGHADIVRYNEVVDIKTCYKLPDNPYIDHLLQVNTYSYLLNKEYCSVLYVQKNDLEVRYFQYKTDKNLFEYCLNNCFYVYNCIKNDVLPEKRQYDFCKLCRFKKLCGGVNEE